MKKFLTALLNWLGLRKQNLKNESESTTNTLPTLSAPEQLLHKETKVGITNNLTELVLPVRLKCEAFVEACHAQGLPIIINETRRALMTQLAYFLQGRIDPTKDNKDIVNEYNRFRKKIGLWEVSTTDALNKKITWTLESNHESGRAFDAVPSKDGKVWWNAPIEVWIKMGEIGESVGLTWGGRWEGTKRDLPHFEA